MNSAIFLDRDGVIIENKADYVRSWDDVVFYPNALEGLACLHQTEYKIVLITNQSAVGRGLISLKDLNDINQQLVKTIEREGGYVDAVYYCPHLPEENCSCRKPKPGLIIRAAEEMNIDLNYSFLIGDAVSDLQAGLAAGVSELILVRTGRGRDQEKLLSQVASNKIMVFDNLRTALLALLENHPRY
jgi:histidinol-phosphate phosphatase family protein